MKSKLSCLKQLENAPDLLIMHAGGYNIGVKQFPLYPLITNLRNLLQSIWNVFPILFLWSQIHPKNGGICKI